MLTVRSIHCKEKLLLTLGGAIKRLGSKHNTTRYIDTPYTAGRTLVERDGYCVYTGPTYTIGYSDATATRTLRRVCTENQYIVPSCNDVNSAFHLFRKKF